MAQRNSVDPTGRAATEEEVEIEEEIGPIGPTGKQQVAVLALLAATVECILERTDSTLAVTNLVAQGAPIAQVVRSACGVKGVTQGVSAEPRPKPKACEDRIFECDVWAKEHKKPDDRYIIYRTVNPASSCGEDFAMSIFAADLKGRPISKTGFHVGLLNGDTVRDNIYPGGISREEWEGQAYEVAESCSSGGKGSTRLVTFVGAVSRGIGEIEIQ